MDLKSTLFSLICVVIFSVSGWSQGTIEARIWNDTNGDGRQNEADNITQSVVVNLLNTSNTVLQTTTTSTGIANFSSVLPGTYKLQFVLPQDHAFTLANTNGVPDDKDSDADRNNGRTGTFSIGPSSSLTTVDAGMWAPGTATTRVFDDQNGDGRQNETAFVSGVTVQVLESNNTPLINPNTGNPVTDVTDSNGEATLDYIPADRSVKLVYTLLDDHAFTLSNTNGVPDDKDSDADRNNGRTGTFSANRGSQNFTTTDAGMWAPGTATTKVFDDINGDGRQNESEVVAGVVVNLLESNNQPVNYPGTTNPVTATTGPNGIAVLPYVPADRSVKLQYELLADHAFTLSNKNGVPDDKDSDADRNNGRTGTFKASRGNQNTEIFDAGMWSPGVATTKVFDDINGDGRQNESEEIENVTVRLLESNNTQVVGPNGPVEATTNSSGIALIPYVPANRQVKLQYLLPSDHDFTLSNKNGVPDDKDSDADRNNGRTGTFQADRGQKNTTNFDAGMWSPGIATTKVFDDINGDGRQNESEVIAGVLVKLLESNNTQVVGPNGPVEATTDGTGTAVIPYVPADRQVKLQYMLLGDHAFTLANKNGVPDDKDSDADRNNGRTGTFQADRGQRNTTNFDAGMWSPGKVTTRVFDDRNGDGRQNESNFIENVVVNLLESNNTPVVNPNTNSPVSATTDANGEAILQYVPADRAVKLQYERPQDHAFTLANKNGVPDDKDSDADRNNGRTGTFQADRGQRNTTNFDAGLWAPGIVRAKVFEDENSDGRQNDDTGVYGVRVNLLESNNQPVLKPNGDPVFAYTECGTFEAVLDYVPADRQVKLQFVLFPGGVFTSANKNGVPDDKDSDADRNNGRTGTFQANRGTQTFTTFDAGVTERGVGTNATVKARVWNDKNGNGKQDDSNANLADVKVRLTDTQGRTCICEKTQGNGIATLPVIGDDQYRLKFDLPQFHAFTLRDKNGVSDNQDSDANGATGLTAIFSINPGQTIENIDAGMWAPGRVEARVFNDKNGNGKQDDSNANLEGVVVNLLDASNGNAFLGTGTTTGNGIAIINNVPADRDVRLEFIRPADHAFTLRNKNGVSDSQDSDANGTNGYTATFRADRGSQTFKDEDAGLWAPGRIEARVFNDKNGNGKQDDSNANLSGVTVNLLDVNNGNNVLGTGVTGGNGIAIINDVPADRPVRLEFILPQDHAFTLRDKNGVSDSQDSDANPGNGRTASFSADRGSQTFQDEDAGLWVPGKVEARVFNDKNGNGKQDDSNANLSGITVRLLDATNNNAELGNAVTQSNGIATIMNVPADRPVRLKFDLPADHAFTLRNKNGVSDSQDSDANAATGMTGTFQATKGSQTFQDEDAGLWVPGRVEARVFNDKNGNGKQDDSNANIANVTVKLLDVNNGNNVLATAQTQSNGIAVLTGVPADRPVRLHFVLPADHAFTLRDKNGVSDSQDSDANGSNGNSGTFQATKGSQTFQDVDAGLWAPGRIEARVFNDKNGNGKQDDSNANISGVTVRLLDPSNGNNVLGTTTSQGNGIATFINVPADRPVRLEFVLPADHAFTLRDKNGVSDSQDSDPNVGSGQTATFQATKGSQTFQDVDAGLWVPGRIETRVFNDKNGNGKQDDSNSNVSGVTVQLLDATNGNAILQSQQTGGNGLAIFNNVPADRAVRLKYILGNGQTFTVRDKNGVSDSQDSDANESSGQTVTFAANRGSQTFQDVDAGLIIVASAPRQAVADEVSNTLSTDEVKIYPVPTSGVLNVAFEVEVQQVGSYRIIDGIGKLIRQAEVELNAGSNRIKLSTEQLPNGIYYLQLNVGESLITKTFQVVK